MSDCSPYPSTRADDEQATALTLEELQKSGWEEGSPLTVWFDYFCPVEEVGNLSKVLAPLGLELGTQVNDQPGQVAFVQYRGTGIWSRNDLVSLDRIGHDFMHAFGGKPDGWFPFLPKE